VSETGGAVNTDTPDTTTTRSSGSTAAGRTPETTVPGKDKAAQIRTASPAGPKRTAEAQPASPARNETPAAPLPAQASSTPASQPVANAAPSVDSVDVPAAAPEPPVRRTTREELTVPKEKVIGIRLETAVSSETAKVEDRVTARVTRDVEVDGVPVVPAGARLEGTVTQVERGGKMRGQARIGIRFTTVVLSSDVKLPIQTEAIVRVGEAPGNEAASKVGAAAVVGTILGGIFGGGQGAAIGGAVGAAGGTAAVMTGDRNSAAIAAGTELTVKLSSPFTVTIERDE